MTTHSQHFAISGPDAVRRLVGLRYVIVALLAASILVLRFVLGMPVPLVPATVGLVALLAINGVVHRQLRRAQPVREVELYANLVAEVMALTGLLFFLGGSTNPLVSLYLLPLTVAANLLSRRHTWTLATLTVMAYSLLLAWHVPLDPHAAHGDDHATSFGLHLFGMWFIFVASAGLIAHYVSSMAQALRDRDRELAAAREEALRSERIVALGTLAAGAAHELGTPLATMSLLAEDMALRHADDPDLTDDVADLQAQVARCKRIISSLAASAGSARGEDAEPQAADRLLDDTIEDWRLMRPTVRATWRWQGGEAPRLVAEKTLGQALINLLNNAADASPGGIEIVAAAQGKEVVIDILDHGPGISAEDAPRVGQPFFTTKSEGGGMGIGLFLANATVERFGGRVSLFNRPGGGACTRITLPTLDAGAA